MQWRRAKLHHELSANDQAPLQVKPRAPRNRPPRRPRERDLARRRLGGGLCLERRGGQDVQLDLPHGGAVIVTVIECRDGRCKLHVEAPRDVLIRRGELVPAAVA